MNPVYLFCAIFGGAFVVLQFAIMAFTGFGGDSDVDGNDCDFDSGSAGADSSDGSYMSDSGHSVLDFLKILSLKTVTAALAFFGFAGLAGESAGLPSYQVTIIAGVSGLIALLLVYFLFRMLRSMNYSGSIQEGSQLGCKGEVYVRIPAKRAGAGKILVTQQKRSMDYDAVSDCEELIPSGSPIVIVEVLSSSLVRVEKI